MNEPRPYVIVDDDEPVEIAMRLPRNDEPVPEPPRVEQRVHTPEPVSQELVEQAQQFMQVVQPVLVTAVMLNYPSTWSTVNSPTFNLSYKISLSDVIAAGKKQWTPPSATNPGTFEGVYDPDEAS